MRHRCGVTSYGALCGIKPSPRHIPFWVQGISWTGTSPARGEDKRPLASGWDFAAGKRLRGHIPLPFASTCLSKLRQQLLSPSPSASCHQRVPVPPELAGGWRGELAGVRSWGASSPPGRQPSSQAGCLLLLLSPPGHLRAGRRTIARRMSKMVPIALATHSRAAGSGGARQLPEKRVLPRRRGCWRR